MPRRAIGTLPSWLAGSGVIAVAMAIMNLGTYGFTILAARRLGPVEYGALAAVMGLLLVVNVVSLGLQATAARRVSANPEHVEAIERRILAVSRRAALALGALCLLASPLVSTVLDLDSWATAALLAVSAVPMTVVGGQAGVLQGERRWAALALVYLATGVGRIGCGTVGVLWRPDPLGAMTGVAAGAFLPTLCGWLALRSHDRAARETPPGVPPAGRLVREVAHNSHALLAFFALSNIDVVMARTVLPEHQAGLYAGGIILTKAVLFLPQFVVVVAFPAMARSGGRRRTNLVGLALVFVIGAVTTVGVRVLSPLAVTFVGGAEYADLEARLWVFAVLGTVLAMLQLMTYQVVAAQHQRLVLLAWAAMAVVLAGAPLTASVTPLLLLVLTVDALLLAALVLGLRTPAAPVTVPPAASPVG